MYIHPFLAGLISTIIFELVLVIVIAVTSKNKENK